MRRRLLPWLCLAAGAGCLLFQDSPAAQAMGRRPPSEKKIVYETSLRAETAEPLTLKDCFELALKRSETLAMKQEDIEATEASFLKATGEFVGDFDFEVTNTRQKVLKSSGENSSVGSTLSAPSRRERKFVINQPLFQGFKTLGALTGAGALRKQREGEWRRAEELLFLDVARSFYDVLLFKKDVETTEGIYQLFKERISELQEREHIGRSRPSEVVSAESRMKILEADLAEARGALEIARQILEFLTGRALSVDQLREEPEISEAGRSLEEYLLSKKTRSDVDAARHGVTTARGAVIVAQSDLWPSFSLVNNQYQKREGFQSGIDWDLLLKFSVPLGKGGTTLGNIKEAVSDWKKAKLTRTLAERQAELDIKQSYQNWLTATNRARALEEAVRAAEENFKQQKEDYRHNLVGNLDVLEALESLHDTRRRSLAATYQMKTNYWRLKVSCGEIINDEEAVSAAPSAAPAGGLAQ